MGIRNLAIGNTDVDWMLGKVVVTVVDNHRNKVVVAEEFEVAAVAVAGLAQQQRVIQQQQPKLILWVSPSFQLRWIRSH